MVLLFYIYNKCLEYIVSVKVGQKKEHYMEIIKYDMETWIWNLLLVNCNFAIFDGKLIVMIVMMK